MKFRIIIEKDAWIVLAMFIIPVSLVLCAIFFAPEPPPKPAVTVQPSAPTQDEQIAAVISECKANAVDASAAPLLLMGSTQEIEMERAAFYDAFWMLAESTAFANQVSTDDPLAQKHLRHIHQLYAAYDIEFKKPRPDLERVRRVRRLMFAECNALRALAKKA